jgi:hypothetical protein
MKTKNMNVIKLKWKKELQKEERENKNNKKV